MIKDYDLDIQYHPGKANVVADALTRKSYCHSIRGWQVETQLAEELQSLNLHIVDKGHINNLEIMPLLRAQIKKAQIDDD